jgi:tetratricopeptide (TPR) repeat protein
MRTAKVFEPVKQERDPLYRYISLALTYQAKEDYTMALVYWSHAIKFVPPGLSLKPQIVREYAQIIQNLLSRQNHPEAEKIKNQLAKFEPNFEALLEKQDPTSLQQHLYLGILHQCQGNYPLSFAYWKRVIAPSSWESMEGELSELIRRAIKDYCWIADQHWRKGEIRKAKEIYRGLIEVYPQFLEGYINLSLIYYNSGESQNAINLLERFEMEQRENLLISRYLDLYKTLEELKNQFDGVPYAAIEKLVEQIRVENIFYPFVQEAYLNLLVNHLIEKERKSFERRRLEVQEKAILGTSKALAKEGISLGERITMARNATKAEIPRFLHDNDPKIIEALLVNPHLTEEDVLIIAQTSKVSEILNLIAHHVRWSNRHEILLAIVCNPQVDPSCSKKILPSLRLKDLTTVFHRKKIAAEVRLEAKRIAREIFIHLSLSDQIAVMEASSGDILRMLDRLPPESLKFLDHVLKRFFHDADMMLNLCRWLETPSEILNKIGESPQWQNHPQIRFALLNNPRTPPHLILKLLEGFEPDELKWMLESKVILPYVKGVIEKKIQEFPATRSDSELG